MMAGEKKTQKPEVITGALKAEGVPKVTEKLVASGRDWVPSDVTISSSTEAALSSKGETHQESVGEHPPTSYYSYYYPGYNGSFAQFDENGYFQTDGSQAGLPSENGSMVYYMPSYAPYAAGTLVGVDGQSVGPQPYFSLQAPVSYGPEAVPCYSWDSTFVGDVTNGIIYGSGPTTFSKSSGYNAAKINGGTGRKLSKSSYAQGIKPLNKVPHLGSDIPAGSFKECHPSGRYSSFNNHKQGALLHNGAWSYKSTGRLWNQNDRYKKANRSVDFENSAELTRGPRGNNKTASSDSSVKEELGFAICKDQYNMPDFLTEYENAKFFVIKSYSEDDIHKCIKYHVWSSTPNGNKKLDTAFHSVQATESKTGTKCPIFLFFSVNGSGQFVGVAEMIGQVDFNKDMDFWQLDKWNGFFPVKWHIIKDIPSNALWHITLENNDNKSVTHSRDTQEIGLKQGLEMLNIFKNYSAKSSLLDDFSFYEEREKSLNAKKKNKPATLQMEIFNDEDFKNQTKAGETKVEGDLMRSKNSIDATSLISLAKNLSLNGSARKSSAI